MFRDARVPCAGADEGFGNKLLYCLRDNTAFSSTSGRSPDIFSSRHWRLCSTRSSPASRRTKVADHALSRFCMENPQPIAPSKATDPGNNSGNRQNENRRTSWFWFSSKVRVFVMNSSPLGKPPRPHLRRSPVWPSRAAIRGRCPTCRPLGRQILWRDIQNSRLRRIPTPKKRIRERVFGKNDRSLQTVRILGYMSLS